MSKNRQAQNRKFRRFFHAKNSPPFPPWDGGRNLQKGRAYRYENPRQSREMITVGAIDMTALTFTEKASFTSMPL